MRRFPIAVRLAITAALLLVVVVVALLAVRQFSTPSPSSTATPAQMMTMDPRIVANLTQIPQATALSGQEANVFTALRAMVDACPAYDDERRNQMVQQIGYIINPSGLRRDAIILLGANPRIGLLKSLGAVTANRWRLDDQPADSCLIPIGKRINEMLVAEGEQPIATFEGD
jgi:hypothetical protein